jgi:uncharacterized protein YjbI with pentapeptide repeats
MCIAENHDSHVVAWWASRANDGEADLRGANLSGANLSGANLSVADLSEANLRGVIL